MKKVYLRRRLVAIGALLVALAVIGTFIWSLVMSVGSVGHAAYNYMHKDELTALNRGEVPQTMLNTGIQDCTADQLTLSLSVVSDSVTSGGSLQFTAELGHKGKISCLVDGSDSSRVLTITSGDETVWSSALCKAGARSLLISDNQKDVQTLTWSTSASSTQCGKKASKPAAAGTYKAKLSLRDVPDVESKEITFEVKEADTSKSDKSEKSDKSGTSKDADKSDTASKTSGSDSSSSSSGSSTSSDSGTTKKSAE